MSDINRAAVAAALASTTFLGTVTIVCSKPGMRRLGIAHPASETYPLDRWTAGELAVFRADPSFTVFVERESSAAPGADTADAVQDNGAGAPVPDLGAKPDGTGPAAPIVEDDGTFRPPVFDNARIEAIRGRFADFGAVFEPNRVDEALTKLAEATDQQWSEVEAMVGFRPTIAEMQEAVRLHVAAQPPISTESEADEEAPQASTGTPPATPARRPKVKTAT